MKFSEQCIISLTDKELLIQQLTISDYPILAIGMPWDGGWTIKDYDDAELCAQDMQVLGEEQEYVFTILCFVFLASEGIFEPEDLIAA